MDLNRSWQEIPCSRIEYVLTKVLCSRPNASRYQRFPSLFVIVPYSIIPIDSELLADQTSDTSRLVAIVHRDGMISLPS